MTGIVKHIIYCFNATAQDFAGEYGIALQQFKSAIRMPHPFDANLRFIKCRAFTIPDIARAYLLYCAGCEQFLKILPRIGQHFIFKLAHIRQKRLAIKRMDACFMQHEMIHRRIGKAEKNLLAISGRMQQFIMSKQMRQQPVGVISANGAQYHVDRRITKSIQQILRAGFGMAFEKLNALAGICSGNHFYSV